MLVLDHVHRVAYVGRSDRTDETVLQRFSEEFGYAVVLFDTADRTGSPIYHTNVLMNVGTDLALVGTPVIAPADRPRVLDSLRDTGHEVVELTMEQLEDFAGNALEVQGSPVPASGHVGAGRGLLTAAQRATIERRVPSTPSTSPRSSTPAGPPAACSPASISRAAERQLLRHADVGERPVIAVREAIFCVTQKLGSGGASGGDGVIDGVSGPVGAVGAPEFRHIVPSRSAAGAVTCGDVVVECVAKAPIGPR